MNTTELFVEIIVIGIGAVTWLSLFMLSFIGYQFISWEGATTLASLLPFLTIVYIFGIAMDRIADSIFSRWDKRLRKIEFINNDEYHAARNYTYTYASAKIVGLFEYGRSRLRISRAWSLNFPLIAVSSLSFLQSNNLGITENLKIRLMILIIVVCGFGFFSNISAWRKLAKNDYKRLAEMIIFLKQESGNKN